MRYIGYYFLCLLLVPCAQAAFYITAAGGGTQTTANWDIETSADFKDFFGTTETFDYSTDASEEVRSGVGQLGVGWGLRFGDKQQFFLGLEASIAQISAQPEIENQAVVGDVFTDPSANPGKEIVAQLVSVTKVFVVAPDMNLDLKFGVKISPYTLFYLKGGLVVNELELESSTALVYDSTFLNGADYVSTIENTETQEVMGFNFALGLEHLLTRYLAINLEYQQIDYGNISTEAVGPTISGAAPGVTIPEGLHAESSADVYRNGIMLGAVLYLGKQYE